MFDPTPPVSGDIVGIVFDRAMGGDDVETFEVDPLLVAEFEVVIKPTFDDVVIGII